jgi:hypothetical protein
MKTAKRGSALGKARRGRPALDIRIRQFIYRQASENHILPPEQQLPMRVLADQIYKSLVEQFKGKKRVKLPKVSTIVKEIQKCYKNLTTLDSPWSVQTLTDYPLPPEALPLVLRIWVKRREMGRDLTIREAQWIARLHALADRLSLDELDFIAQNYAVIQVMATKFGTPEIPLIGDRGTDLALYEFITGDRVDQKRATKILGHPEVTPDMSDPVLYGTLDGLDEIKAMAPRQFLHEMRGDK